MSTIASSQSRPTTADRQRGRETLDIERKLHDLGLLGNRNRSRKKNEAPSRRTEKPKTVGFGTTTAHSN